MSTGSVVKVAGPLVVAQGMRDANMFDVVRVMGIAHRFKYMKKHQASEPARRSNLLASR